MSPFVTATNLTLKPAFDQSAAVPPASYSQSSGWAPKTMIRSGSSAMPRAPARRGIRQLAMMGTRRERRIRIIKASCECPVGSGSPFVGRNSSESHVNFEGKMHGRAILEAHRPLETNEAGHRLGDDGPGLVP